MATLDTFETITSAVNSSSHQEAKKQEICGLPLPQKSHVKTQEAGWGPRAWGPALSEGRKQDVSREGTVKIKVASSRRGHLALCVLSCGKRPWAVWVSSHPAANQSPPQPCLSLSEHSLTPGLGVVVRVSGERRTGCNLSEGWIKW